MAKYSSLNQNKWVNFQLEDSAYDYGANQTKAIIQAIGGIYRATLPTYTDGDATILHFTSDGKLMVDTELTLDGSVIINNLGGAAAHDAAVAGNPLLCGAEAKDFDGAALPNAVSAEADAVRIAATKSGVLFSMPVNEDGSKTTIYAEDSAHTSTDGGTFIFGIRNDADTTLVDASGDYAPLQVDAAGALKVATTGTSKYENATYGETESEANDSEFNTSVIYGMDTEAVATSQLRAVQVAADNAGVSATPNVLEVGGIYKNSFDTYDDNDAAPLHMDVNGLLLVNIGRSTGTATATNAGVSVGAVTTVVLAANASRRFAIIVNDSDETVYLALEDAAVASQGIRLNPHGGSFEINGMNLFTGAINGICASGGKVVTICEG